ncbi:MAG: HNH endonuclease [Patescibacteria group bacterium]|nr:HNH endonuclease [Patescibacteria group bacterium]
MKKTLPILLATCSLAFLLLLSFANQKRSDSAKSPDVLSARTTIISYPTGKAFVYTSPSLSTGCQTKGGLPDTRCTPGAIITQTTKDEICQAGYAKSVRNVSESEKKQAYAEYGIFSHATGEYEVDHLVSLELGGSNDIANLWPEAAAPTPGFHEKDKVENYLHKMVCNGSITLVQAQQEIATDWLQVYQQMK